MFWKKKNKLCKRVRDKQEIKENEASAYKPKTNRRIIGRKLYDTSKAKRICDIVLSCCDIPGYNSPIINLGGEYVVIYKGVNEWFIEYLCSIEPVTEDWVKSILGERNVDKYIELFGEVEEA